MSNYVVTTNFAAKDALAHLDPLKVAKGTEISAELNNIATAVATKEDLANKNVNSGYAGLDASARIVRAQAPAGLAYGDTVNTFTAVQTIQPVSGTALTVNGTTGSYTAIFQGPVTTSQSNGPLVRAGTNGSDYCMRLQSQAGTLEYFGILGNGTGLFSNTTTNAPFTFQGSGTVSVGGGLIAAGNIITSGGGFSGNGASITALNAAQLTTGVISAARTGASPASGSRWLFTPDGLSNTWTTIAFSDITGTATVAQVPSLPTSQITSGTFADARIASTNVTQYQAALTIATTQLSGTLVNGTVAVGNVTQFNSSINGRNITAKAGISKTLQAGGTASGGSDGDIIYIY